MRRARAIWLGLLLCSLAGCFTADRPVKSASLLDRLRGSGPTGPDAVFIEYAVIERPAGSTAINRDVWANIDELILPSDSRALLAENGLRAGVVGGLLPSELETMIANPKSTVGHRQRRLLVNNPAVLPLNGPMPLAEYQVRGSFDVPPNSMAFEQARFSVSITPRHSKDGRITLQCMPEVEYQDKKHWLPPGAAGAAWAHGKPIERYQSLAWEVTLSPREFVVIGAFHERGAWLGNQVFGGTSGDQKIQRLLIVRTGRVTPVESGPELPANASDRDAPIASQASVSAVRGQRP